eukprot:CAMPEP_0172493240 /NCGR_PEP_ID=MMETSP1066-20121228/24615_1 /TAXON_ID=671091 /ORGANISM="Coscinodiscus wailesii, Strain CCMP2513" /LENGTH=238 /DNA_ID=CAMNT_0013263299 /DNA_START=64 /DNA_END=777 /DNA_ORIENTATION=-
MHVGYFTNLLTIVLSTTLLLRPNTTYALATRPKKRTRPTSNGFPSLHLEQDLRQRGYTYIIGSDEAGRGSIAGPVVCASCCLLKNDSNNDEYPPLIEGVQDSKLLSPEQRIAIYDRIVSQPDSYAWCTSQRSNDDIDTSGNILKTTMDCFRDSIETLLTSHNLPLDAAYSVVDGKKSPRLSQGYDGVVPCRPYVRGDVEVYTVALASIIARVTHERLMTDLHDIYPAYGFRENFGYGW